MIKQRMHWPTLRVTNHFHMSVRQASISHRPMPHLALNHRGSDINNAVRLHTQTMANNM